MQCGKAHVSPCIVNEALFYELSGFESGEIHSISPNGHELDV
mgnify:FL=1